MQHLELRSSKRVRSIRIWRMWCIWNEAPLSIRHSSSPALPVAPSTMVRGWRQQILWCWCSVCCCSWAPRIANGVTTVHATTCSNPGGGWKLPKDVHSNVYTTVWLFMQLRAAGFVFWPFALAFWCILDCWCWRPSKLIFEIWVQRHFALWPWLWKMVSVLQYAAVNRGLMSSWGAWFQCRKWRDMIKDKQNKHIKQIYIENMLRQNTLTFRTYYNMVRPCSIEIVPLASYAEHFRCILDLQRSGQVERRAARLEWLSGHDFWYPFLFIWVYDPTVCTDYRLLRR